VATTTTPTTRPRADDLLDATGPDARRRAS